MKLNPMLAFDDVLARARTQLTRLTRRFDSRPQRERMVLLVAAAAAAFWLADKLWITPAFERSRAAATHLATARSGLDTLRAESARLQTLGAEQDRQLREDIAQARQRADGEANALRHYESSLIGSDHMVELLEQMLPRNGSLKVRELKSLGQVDLLADASKAPAAAGAQGAMTHPTPSAPGPGLYRHGVELTLEGSWSDLLAYLSSLEGMPRHVLWGGMSLKAEQYPKVVLTVRLYTLSLDRGWLEI